MKRKQRGVTDEADRGGLVDLFLHLVCDEVSEQPRETLKGRGKEGCSVRSRQ